MIIPAIIPLLAEGYIDWSFLKRLGVKGVVHVWFWGVHTTIFPLFPGCCIFSSFNSFSCSLIGQHGYIIFGGRSLLFLFSILLYFSTIASELFSFFTFPVHRTTYYGNLLVFYYYLFIKSLGVSNYIYILWSLISASTPKSSSPKALSSAGSDWVSLRSCKVY